MLARLQQSYPRASAYARARRGASAFRSAQTGAARFQTTVSLHPPAAQSPREAPTPLVLVSGMQLQHPNPLPERDALAVSNALWRPWLREFNQHGWSVYTVDVDLPRLAERNLSSGDAVAAALEAELVAGLEHASGGAITAPAIVARGPVAGLAAQAFIASHPASALLLIDPALSYARLAESPTGQHLLPSPPAEPRYEVTFPAHVAWSEAEEARQKAADVPWYEAHHIEHALEDQADAALDKIVWPNVDADGPLAAREWLEDEAGL